MNERKRKNTGLINNSTIEVLKKSNTSSIAIFGKIFFYAIILYLCTYSSVYCLISGIELEVNKKVLNMALFCLTVLFLIIYTVLQKKKYYIRAITIIAYGIIILLLWRKIEEGFYIVSKRFIELANDYYSVYWTVKPMVVTDEELKAAFFFIFIGVTVMVFASHVIFHGSGKFLYLLVSLIFVLFPLFIGEVPAEFPAIIYLVSTVTILSSKHLQVRNWIILSMLFILILIYKNFPPAVYEEKIDIVEIKHSIQDYMDDLANGNIENEMLSWIPFFNGRKANGGLNSGKLGGFDKVDFQNNTVLEVTLNSNVLSSFFDFLNRKAGTIYLKGYIGSIYTKRKWQALSEEEEKYYEEIVKEFNKLGINIETGSWYQDVVDEMGVLTVDKEGRIEEIGYPETGYNINTMTVENIDAGKDFIFVPYHTKQKVRLQKNGRISFADEEWKAINKIDYNTFDTTGMTEQTLSLLYKDRTNISMLPFHFREFQKQSDSRISDLLEKYETFIYDTYTEIPEGNAPRAMSLFSEKEYDRSIEELSRRVSMVVEYLERYTSYTLSPGRLPRGEDFVDYFLFESKKGYCSYYASTAVVLLRSLGIPARYVEGFLIDMDNSDTEITDNMETTYLVKDSNAHAWVEVYVDYYGWVPIEVTVGYNMTNILPGSLEKSNERQKTNEQEKKEIQKEPDVTPAPKKTETIQTETQKKEKLDKKQLENWKRLWIQIIVYSILISAAILIIWFIHKKIQEKKWNSFHNTSKKLLYQYKNLMRLLSYSSIPYKGETAQEYAEQITKHFPFIDQEIMSYYMDLVLKAKFAGTAVTQEELEEANSYYKVIKQDIYKNASLFKKLYLRYNGLVLEK